LVRAQAFRLLGRHLFDVFSAEDGSDEQASVGIARDDGRTGVSPLPETLPGVETQAALELLGRRAVAGVAAFHENRTDPLLEEVHPFRS
jgi:hypothetical protein